MNIVENPQAQLVLGTPLACLQGPSGKSISTLRGHPALVSGGPLPTGHIGDLCFLPSVEDLP